jgi:hypothetical protein
MSSSITARIAECPVGHDLDRFTVSTERDLEEPACRVGVASR